MNPHERNSQTGAKGKAAFEVVDNLGVELFSLFSSFHSDLPSARSTTSLTLDGITKAAVKFRTSARFPGLLKDLVYILRGASGVNQYLIWDDAQWKESQKPDWLPEGRAIPPISLDSPVFIVPLDPTSPQDHSVQALGLRFDSDRILHEIVPTLVRQSFSEDGELPTFRVQLVRQGLSTPGTDATTDLQIPLLPWTRFDSWFDHYLVRMANLEKQKRMVQLLDPSLLVEGKDLDQIIEVTKEAHDQATDR